MCLKSKAIFLERDGTINEDYGYVYKLSDLKLIEGVTKELTRLQDKGYLLIIVTNQSGIGRNKYTYEDALRFNDGLLTVLKKEKVFITDVFMCPHVPEENCECRKPKPGMLRGAMKKYNIDPGQSYMLGDKMSDVECGQNAGVSSFLITQKNDLHHWVDLILKEDI